MLKILKCARCGKEYETDKKFSMYCSNHCKNFEPRICKICGKEFEGKIISNKQTCSKECSKQLREQTTLDKDRVKNIDQNDEIKTIIQEKRKEQMPLILYKMKHTNTLKNKAESLIQGKAILATDK